MRQLPNWFVLRSVLVVVAALIALCAFSPAVRAAVDFTNVVVFNQANGAIPYGNFFRGADGYFYIAASQGGDWGTGAIVKIAPDGSSTDIFSFTNGIPNPAFPGSIMPGGDGYIYGTAGGGSNVYYGSVFRMDTNGNITDLFSFSGTNGCSPNSLFRGRDGNFYGTTYFGGIGFSNGNNISGDGTIFKLTTNSELTTLVWFNGTNGANPDPMTIGADDNFYGVTDAGGTDTNINTEWKTLQHAVGFGVAYELPTNGNIQVLASFTHTNGGGATTPLIQGADGHFYGATMFGGAFNLGTIFQLTTNQTLNTIASFDGTNGADPTCLLQAPDGNFYGGSQGYDGDMPWANIFQVTPSGTITSLYSFAAPDADWPAGLTQEPDGDLYGTTETGGGLGWGTFFRVSVPVCPVLQSSVTPSGTVNLTWNSAAQQTYQVQFTADPTQTNWTNLGAPFTATNGTMSLPDSPGPAAQRFYRVLISP